MQPTKISVAMPLRTVDDMSWFKLLNGLLIGEQLPSELLEHDA